MKTMNTMKKNVVTFIICIIILITLFAGLRLSKRPMQEKTPFMLISLWTKIVELNISLLAPKMVLPLLLVLKRTNKL